jgi:type I restriction-modification system DNA methylase subunit
MKDIDKGGSRIAIIHNGSPLFTGDAGSGPSEIRRHILENDLLEAIIALPNDIFYNTGIATYIWVLSNKKAGTVREGKVQLINANEMFVKRRKALGNKRNDISEEDIAEITKIYGDFKASEISQIYLVTNVHNTSNNAGKKRNLIRGLCADIKDVSFSLDSKIFGEDFEVLPLGIGKNAYRMQEDILFCKERGNANSTFNELVVMSPFLSESVIADFNLTDRALSDCKRTLVTRRSELGKLKASDVDNFTIYALKDEIIDGEEEISDELADKKKQDIHAKIYLRRKYSDVDL